VFSTIELHLKSPPNFGNEFVRIRVLRLSRRRAGASKPFVGELAIARSRFDAPEIDGLVQIQDGREAGLKPGDIVDVEILGSDEHDLFGEVSYAS